MTISDISLQVKEAYGVDVGEGTLSNVINCIPEYVWKRLNGPLEALYFTLWMDALNLK